jgi:UDP-MurNAc hydroxylase
LREPRKIGNTSIEILPHQTNSISDIDSAIIIKYFDGDREHCLVNTNDVIFDDAMIHILKRTVNEPDILFCGYTGAGPYPQTYFDFDDPRLLEEAEKKRLMFFDRYLRLTTAINAKVNIPFAGKYILGGKLAKLNAYRGVADAIEVLEIDPKALVLADDGGEINTSDLKPTAVRIERYSFADINRRQNEICTHKMDYERLIDAQEIHQLPIKRLLVAAARRASEKSECETDYFFVIALPNNEMAIINANKAPERLIRFAKNISDLPEPRSEIYIDPRYLFGLLANVYHWNNAEVGSQYNTRRIPNELNRAAQLFLNYLAT